MNAIRTISKRRLIFYVNAYQSWLWNRTIAEYLAARLSKSWKVDYSMGELVFSDERLEDVDVAIIGYNSELVEFEEIYVRLLEEEKLKQEDFLIKELPELISEGTTRKMYAELKGLSVKYEKDERHKDKIKAVLEFQLGPGSYATIVVRKMFG